MLFGYALAIGTLLLLLWPSGQKQKKLNALRQRALDILAEVVPSAYPDSRFAKLGWDPAKVPAGSTSCGALPAYMGIQLGDPTGITKWGVPGVRTEGQAHNNWVVPSAGRPSPGDIFITTSDPALSIVMHTAVLVDRAVLADGTEIWTSADAGQGTRDAQRAAYVKRHYDPHTNRFLRIDGIGDPRYLGGWIDLDRWVFPSKGKAFLPALKYPPHPCDPTECS